MPTRKHADLPSWGEIAKRYSAHRGKPSRNSWADAGHTRSQRSLRCAVAALLIGGAAVLGFAVASYASIAGTGGSRPFVARDVAHQASALTNRHLADVDARHLLGLLTLPIGATRVDRQPLGGIGVLSHPAILLGSRDLVDLHEWWRVPAGTASVLRFIEAHSPGGAKPTGRGHLGAKGVRGRYLQFSWPAVREELEVRSLVVSVVALRHGATGLRADAEIQWIVPRSASERIPREVSQITITRPARRNAAALSIMVTASARVRTIVRWVNRLSTVQPGNEECPSPHPVVPLTLSFRGRDGALLAQASYPVESLAVCDTAMSLSIRGQAQTPLLGGRPLLEKIGRLLGTPLLAP